MAYMVQGLEAVLQANALKDLDKAAPVIDTHAAIAAALQVDAKDDIEPLGALPLVLARGGIRPHSQAQLRRLLRLHPCPTSARQRNLVRKK